MSRDYLTVDQISEMLGMHPKTIQRYIREGKLRAVKVGKGWRVSGHDLNIFLERTEMGGNASREERKITASSVIDITTNGAEDAMRIMNFCTSAMTVKPSGFSRTSLQSQYIEQENIIRVTLWGDIRFISAITEMIAAMTDGDKPNEQ